MLYHVTAFWLYTVGSRQFGAFACAVSRDTYVGMKPNPILILVFAYRCFLSLCNLLVAIIKLRGVSPHVKLYPLLVAKRGFGVKIKSHDIRKLTAELKSDNEIKYKIIKYNSTARVVCFGQLT